MRPNQNFRSGHTIAGVGLSQCVHANVFFVINLVAAALGEIRSSHFRYFACSVNAALDVMLLYMITVEIFRLRRFACGVTVTVTVFI